ncbi:cytochrome c/FTR1 family iron permease [soil metagenome]
MSRLSLVILAFLCACVLGTSVAHSQAPSPEADPRVAWRLLDYLAVDYSGAVENGQIVNASEFAEMNEFAASAEARITALPANARKGSLLDQAHELQAIIKQQGSASYVATAARNLAADLLTAYPATLAPTSLPDMGRAASLYADNCAICHGATGQADGAGSVGLDPKPVAFSDHTRARERSPFALYQVIQQGLDGTAMASFSDLPEADRWALAYYVNGLSFTEADRRKGETIWKSDAAVQRALPNLQALTAMSEAQLAAVVGADKARPVLAYLRANPGALTERAAGGTLAIAREKIAAAVEAYRMGGKQRANDLALAAYLDGFEPLEPVLSARDGALMRRIEQGMADLRSAVSRDAGVATVTAAADRANGLLDLAERALASKTTSAGAAFAGSFTVLLREGLEALLIVVAILAFLKKAGRPEVAAYVHGGWLSALAAGVLTWAAATFLISISGASREFTEGFGSLLAALVLVSVGIWMHGKSQADAWQTYIRDKMSKALSRRSAWFLFLLAFVVVYREVFETILFLVALWSQGGHVALLLGVAAAALTLAVIAWALLGYSRRLPIGKFFAFSSILLAVLAVVLAGKGISGLQEAGLVDLHPLRGFPRFDLLGLFPTWETVMAQVLVAVTLIIGFNWGRMPMAGKRNAPEGVL